MRRRSLLAAAFLVAVTLPLAPAQDLLGAATTALGDQDGRVRQKAVQDLAKLDTPEAWALVVRDGLRDLEARVADEAQLQIGRATFSPALENALDSRDGLGAREPLVRQRIAEALGTVSGEVSTSHFESLARDRDAEVRAATFYALERRVLAGQESGVAARVHGTDAKRTAALVKAVHKAAKSDRSPRARANALGALDSLTRAGWATGARGAERALDGAPALLQEAAADRDALVRAASLPLLSRRDARAAPPALISALASPVPGVVATAIDVARERGDRDAMSLLIDALGDAESPLRPALAQRAVRVLRDASGLSHAATAVDRWKRWCGGLDGEWRAATGSEPRAGPGGDEPRTTTFFGLPLVSDAVVFLVDMSGSMWSDRDGPPRKLAVDAELSRALGKLPPSARFDVVPYANAPEPWQGELTTATKRNVERAIQSFRGSGLRGKGDVWSALLPVLGDEAVDTIVILTDGAPTGGARWNVGLMRSLLADRNRHRRAVIHVVLFDASRTLERLWKGVAEDSGGVLHVID